jgi:hypothetical protein
VASHGNKNNKVEVEVEAKVERLITKTCPT